MVRFRLKNLIRRLLVGFFSEKTYNKMAFLVFSFGYYTQMYPIEKPLLRNVDLLGEVVFLKYRFNPYQRYMRAIGVFSVVLYLLFEVLQMVRFVPTDGFTLRVVYIMFYFALAVICSLTAYNNFKNERLLPFAWNCIESNTKLSQRKLPLKLFTLDT